MRVYPFVSKQDLFKHLRIGGQISLPPHFPQLPSPQQLYIAPLAKHCPCPTHPVVVELLAAFADRGPVGRDVLEVSFHLDHEVPLESRERSGLLIRQLQVVNNCNRMTQEQRV